MPKLLLTIVICCFFVHRSAAQVNANYAQDVQTIRNYDKMYQFPAHPILFVGSSSMRKWEHLQIAFGSYNVVNRGIGGAVIDDISFYINDLIFAYSPRQILLYVGENDLVNENNNADSILNKTIRLYKLIRTKLPDIPVDYIAMKPSPSRDKFSKKAVAANTLIRQFLATEKNTAFIDIYPLMISKDGRSRPELFVSDMLHMNAKGYAIWEKAVRPYLLK